MEDLVRRKGDTLLTALLDDPAGSKDKEGTIFVQGNPKLFPLILDWYRYGKILLPPYVSKSQIARECAFYQLPEADLDIITRERVGDVLREGSDGLTELLKKTTADKEEKRRKLQSVGQDFAATMLYEAALKELCEKKVWEGTTTSSLAGPWWDEIGVDWYKPEQDDALIIQKASDLASADGWDVTVTRVSGDHQVLRLEDLSFICTLKLARQSYGQMHRAPGNVILSLIF
eukprot:2785749-Amphidinium_carterae.1